jgi:hypothetical protein
MMTSSVTHGMKLLNLILGKDSRKLRLHVLVEGTELLAALIRRQRCIGPKGGHLLLLISEDGLKLSGLIGRKAKTLANPLRGALGIRRVIVPVVAFMRRGVGGG